MFATSPARSCLPRSRNASPTWRPRWPGVSILNKDRITGAAEPAKGAVKEAAGKLGNPVGGAKDAVRDAVKTA
jgi:uncharacterized protein YjbJ (UPF0337 family)